MEDREVKLQAMRDTLHASIAEGGGMTGDEVAIWLHLVAAESKVGLARYEP